MPSPPIVGSLTDFESRLKGLRTGIKREEVKAIAKKSLRTAADQLGTEWFSSIEPELRTAGLDASLLLTYSENFEKLIKLALPNNLRMRYLQVLNAIIRKFQGDLILSLKKTPPTPTSQLEKLLTGLTNTPQTEYLKKAIECSRYR